MDSMPFLLVMLLMSRVLLLYPAAIPGGNGIGLLGPGTCTTFPYASAAFLNILRNVPSADM